MIPIPDDLLFAVRDYTFEVLDKNAHTNVYTNINRLYRIEKNIKLIIKEDALTNVDVKLLTLCNYITSLEQAQSNLKIIDFDEIQNHVNKIADDAQKQFSIPENLLQEILKITSEAIPNNEKVAIEAQILSDAFIMDFTDSEGEKHLKQFYEQLIMRDLHVSRKGWYDILINILKEFKISTNYGKAHIKPKIEELKEKIKKERKEIEHRKELLAQRELKISDAEIKKLKKDLEKVSNRDDRGIQTLFRNTSRNHYTLNQMVDGKASIMITVNSIILSAIMSGLIGSYEQKNIVKYTPIFILAIINLISITFAIIAIRPIRTQGNFTEEEIRNKKGNLLYFGNFHNMLFRDFEWGFLQMLNDKNYLYSAMIRDYYYQGHSLYSKYKSIRISLTVFLVGLAFAIISHLIIQIESMF
jgi:hypothetical protein